MISNIPHALRWFLIGDEEGKVEGTSSVSVAIPSTACSVKLVSDPLLQQEFGLGV